MTTTVFSNCSGYSVLNDNLGKASSFLL
jgi:hypothetical protein